MIRPTTDKLNKIQRTICVVLDFLDEFFLLFAILLEKRKTIF